MFCYKKRENIKNKNIQQKTTKKTKKKQLLKLLKKLNKNR